MNRHVRLCCSRRSAIFYSDINVKYDKISTLVGLVLTQEPFFLPFLFPFIQTNGESSGEKELGKPFWPTSYVVLGLSQLEKDVLSLFRERSRDRRPPPASPYPFPFLLLYELYF